MENIGRKTRRRTVEQVQRDLLKDLVAHVNKSGNLKTIHERHANLNVFMPSWTKRDDNSPLQSKAPMIQPEVRASHVVIDWGEEKDQQNARCENEIENSTDVSREHMRQVLMELLDQQMRVQCEKDRNLMEIQKEKERREMVMKELLTFHAQQQIKKNRKQMVEVFEELMTFHIQQKIQKNKEKMLEVFHELMTFHVEQKIERSKRHMREVFSELMTFHEQQKTEKSKEQMRTVFTESMTLHSHRRTKENNEKMRCVITELMQTNSQKKTLRSLEEEVCEKFVPRKLFLFNISTFKPADDHPFQGQGYPDFSTCRNVVSADLATPTESKNGAQDVVTEENGEEEGEKIHVETPSKKEKKNEGLRKRIRRLLGLK